MFRSLMCGLRVAWPMLLSLAACCLIVWTGPMPMRLTDPVIVGLAVLAGMWIGSGAVFSAWEDEHRESRKEP